jgi:hypothetical protein
MSVEFAQPKYPLAVLTGSKIIIFIFYSCIKNVYLPFPHSKNNMVRPKSTNFSELGIENSIVVSCLPRKISILVQVSA